MIAFAILGTVALVAAILVVASPNPVISALWLALALVAVAGLFVVLGAEFLAVVQIIVYAGAILVFFLFVIMLLGLGTLPAGDPRPIQRGLGLYLALAMAVILAFAVRDRGDSDAAASGRKDFIEHAAGGNTEAVAELLYKDYIFPFEATSLLLTGAVVGAVVLARRREGEAVTAPPSGSESAGRG